MVLTNCLARPLACLALGLLAPRVHTFQGLRWSQLVIHLDKAGAGAIAPEQRLLLREARDPHGLGAEIVFPVGFVFAQHSTGDTVGAPGPFRNPIGLTALRAGLGHWTMPEAAS